VSTSVPGWTGSEATTPAEGACTGCSSFIASRVSSSSPARTRWPGTTSTRRTAPGNGAISEPSAASGAGSGKRESSRNVTEPSGLST
jgi:hypothetical protein